MLISQFALLVLRVILIINGDDCQSTGYGACSHSDELLDAGRLLLFRILCILIICPTPASRVAELSLAVAGGELTLFSSILTGIFPSLSIDHDYLHLLANEEWPVHLNSLVCFLQDFEHLSLEVLVFVIKLVLVFFHDTSLRYQLVKILD